MALTLLWATDGSAHAAEALPFIEHLFRPLAPRVIVATVAPKAMLSAARPDPTQLFWRLLPGYQEKVTEGARNVVEEAARQLPPGLEAETGVRSGLPIAEIAALARERAVDVVLIG